MVPTLTRKFGKRHRATFLFSHPLIPSLEREGFISVCAKVSKVARSALGADQFGR